MNNVHFEETTEYIKIFPEKEKTEAVFLFFFSGLVDLHAYISFMNKTVEKGRSSDIEITHNFSHARKGKVFKDSG